MRSKKKIMFVCRVNVNRSPTAKRVFKDLLQRHGLEDRYEASSAGVHHLSTIPLDRKSADAQHVIFAMDDEINKSLKKEFGQPEEKIHVLGVLNHYVKEDPKLVGILEDKLIKWLKTQGHDIKED